MYRFDRAVRGLCVALCFLLPTTPLGSTRADDLRAPAGAPVVLLHGLARTRSSMESMAEALESAGYRVCNVAYPSRHHTVERLATDFVAPAIASCFSDPEEPIHFVTHSLGGILVRQLAATGDIRHIGRVVMLSPPNRGSEVVDRLGSWWLFEWLNGPAGLQLGTALDAPPMKLGPATFEVGIITGSRSINLGLSMLIPGVDDGKVAVSRAQLDGMADFLVVPTSHPFIMGHERVIEQTLHFLWSGRFERSAADDTER